MNALQRTMRYFGFKVFRSKNLDLNKKSESRNDMDISDMSM